MKYNYSHSIPIAHFITLNKLQTELLLSEKKQIKPRAKFEFNLEGLRGFAAMLVVFHHLLAHKFSLDPAYTPSSTWLNTSPGHSSVLLFFILSGYVIGLTNTKFSTIESITAYLRKRLIRLYPIYIISLLFALLVARNHYSLKIITGNFLFLQNSVVPLIFENNPLWSLNSEVIYYLLFIPLSFSRLNYGWASFGSMAIGIICATVLPHALVSSYFLGFAFWSSGLWLAQSRYFEDTYSSPWLLTALLCLFIGYETLNPFTTALKLAEEKFSLHFTQLQIPGVFLEDLLQLPFFFYLFLRFINKNIRNGNIFLFVIIISCLANYYFNNNTQGLNSPYVQSLIIPVLFILAGSLLFCISLVKPVPTNSKDLSNLLIKLGSISYGIYVIHFPISLLLSRISIFSGSLLTFCFRALLDVLLVLGTAYVLEWKVQPWAKAHFDALLARW